jgi:hypothetical protein
MKTKVTILIFISLFLVSCAPETSKQESQIGVVEVATFAPYPDWISLGSPPNGAAKIVSARDSTIWVESSLRELFVMTLDFDFETNQIYWDWKPATSKPEDNGANWPLRRGADCTSISPVTWNQLTNPNGEMQECVYAPSPGVDRVAEFYFALMSDGTIQFFDITSSYLPR